MHIHSSSSAFSVASDLSASYAFTEINSNFRVNAGDSSHHELACVTANVVPPIGDSLNSFLSYFPLAILLLVGFATTCAALFSPWGSFNPLHLTSNFHRDEDLLRLMTPGFADCLFHIQYVVLAGSLSLDYPGFYQPVVANGAWSVLLFGYSFVSNKSYQTVQDGLYAIDFGSEYGLTRLSQLCGLGSIADIWPGHIIWMLVVLAAGLLIGEAMLAVHWLILRTSRHPSSAAKAGRYNIPYTLGNGIRIIWGYFLFPLTTLTLFQIVAASSSPTGSIVAAVLLFVALLASTGYIMVRMRKRKPRSFLFDDFKTLLIFGPLYNTYTDTHDQHALFALLEPTLNIIRAIACGAAQGSGIAQIALLAIVEVLHLLMIMAFRPYHHMTHTNAYHNVFTCIRFVTVILSVAFVPELAVNPAPKGIIGYIILCVHACVLIFGFFLNAFQTLAEVFLRLLGVGSDSKDVESTGLMTSLGLRHLSTRKSRFDVPRHHRGPNRPYSSQAEMLMRAADQADGHSRNGSRGSRAFLNSADPSSQHNRAYSLGAATAVGTADSRSTGMTPPYYYPNMARTVGPNYRVVPLNHDLHGMPMAEKRYMSHSEYNSYAAAGGGLATAGRRSASRNGNSMDLMNSSLDAADITDYGADNAAHWRTASAGASDRNAVGYVFVNGKGYEYSPMAVAAAAGGRRKGARRHEPLWVPNYDIHDNESRPNHRTTDYAVREADFFYGTVKDDADTRQGDMPGGGGASSSAPTAAAAGVTAVATVAKQWVKGLFGRGKVKEQHRGFEVVRNRPPPGMRWGPSPKPAAGAAAEESGAKKSEDAEGQMQEHSSKEGLVAGGTANETDETPPTHDDATGARSSQEEGLMAGVEAEKGVDYDLSFEEPYHDEPNNRSDRSNDSNRTSTLTSTARATRPNSATSEATKKATVLPGIAGDDGDTDLLPSRSVHDTEPQASYSSSRRPGSYSPLASSSRSTIKALGATDKRAPSLDEQPSKLSSTVSSASFHTAGASPKTNDVSRQSSGASQAPTIPRKSSKRESAVLREETARAVQEAMENMPKSRGT